MTRRSIVGLFAVAVLSATAATLSVQAYASYAKWSSPRVDFYINPQNADVTPDAATSAVVAGARTWTAQSNAAFEWVYAGPTNDAATANDGRNVVFFRSTTNGSNIASTYSWWSSGRLLDADIIFWDGGFRFFTGTSGCGGSNAAYIEDIAAHEFGHAAGLSHSTVPGATMTPGYSTCSMTQRSLEADDIAGIEALYPPTADNAAPSITISAPAAGTTVSEGTMVSFAGLANDAEDGLLSGAMSWTSSRDGLLGRGGAFQRVLTVGTHTLSIRVTDSAGATTEVQRTLTVAAQAGTGFPLSAAAYKVKGLHKVDLRWSGSSATVVDIFRNSKKITTSPNTGSFVDAINVKGSGTYSYMVCEAGSTNCSSQARVVF